MLRCLVTGASGFIGPRLVARLQADGHEVACLVRATSKTDRLTPLDVRLVTGDVTDPASLPAALEGVDRVYHLAGRTHARSLAEFLRVNEQGQENLHAACAKRESPPVMVMASSLAAAGPSESGKPHTEADPPQPISLYGRSKLAGELVARKWAAEVPTTIVRPPVVFGPGDRDGLALFKSIKYTRLHLVPQLQGLPLSLIHADDLANALALAADKGDRLQAGDEVKSQGLYYAADPNESSWAEAGRMAAAAMGVRVLVVCRRKYPFLIPALVADGIAKITGKPGVFGMDKLKEASASGWVCDSSRASEQLGFAPAASLAERYQQTFDWYRSAGWL